MCSGQGKLHEVVITNDSPGKGHCMLDLSTRDNHNFIHFKPLRRRLYHIYGKFYKFQHCRLLAKNVFAQEKLKFSLLPRGKHALLVNFIQQKFCRNTMYEPVVK